MVGSACDAISFGHPLRFVGQGVAQATCKRASVGEPFAVEYPASTLAGTSGANEPVPPTAKARHRRSKLNEHAVLSDPVLALNNRPGGIVPVPGIVPGPHAKD